MNQAIKIGTNELIDISNYENGNNALLLISEMNLKCSDEKCNASLQLCSFKEYNLPVPYFKTINGTQHRDGCINSVRQYQYSEDEINNTRYTGESAFNAIRRKYSKNSIKSVAIYNHSSGTREYIRRKNDSNLKIRSKSKTGPIIYDDDMEILENKTYLVNLSEFKVKDSNYGKGLLNLSTFGLRLTNISKEFIKDKENITIVFISRFINNKNNWKYSSTPNIIFIENNKIIYEQSWKDFNAEKSKNSVWLDLNEELKET